MENRNKVKNWSITFPQCGDIERKDFADTFPPYEKVIVSREEHEDGGYHLHMGIGLRKGITKKNMLKWIEGKWPNDYKRIDVQATRSINCWSDYIAKEDVDRYDWADASLLDKRNAKVLETIANLERDKPVNWSEWKRENGLGLYVETEDPPELKKRKEEWALKEKYKAWYADFMKM